MRVTSTHLGRLLVGMAMSLAVVGCQSDATRPSSADTNVSVPTGGTTGVSAPAQAPPSTADEARLPDREPDVTGLVSDGYRLVQPSDLYYVNMLLIGRSVDPVVVGPDGGALSMEDLNVGDAVAVWVATPGCAESNPVQCDVVGIRVIRP